MYVILLMNKSVFRWIFEVVESHRDYFHFFWFKSITWSVSTSILLINLSVKLASLSLHFVAGD
jgi:hypothetical protein